MWRIPCSRLLDDPRYFIAAEATLQVVAKSRE